MECCLPPGAPALISRRPHRRGDQASAARSPPTIIQHQIRVSTTISSHRMSEQPGVSFPASIAPAGGWRAQSPAAHVRGDGLVRSKCPITARLVLLQEEEEEEEGAREGRSGGVVVVRNRDKFKFKRGGEKRCGDGRG